MRIVNLKVTRNGLLPKTKLIKVGMNYPICETRVDKYGPRHKESISFLYNSNLSKYKVRKKKKIKRIKKEEKEKY